MDGIEAINSCVYGWSGASKALWTGVISAMLHQQPCWRWGAMKAIRECGLAVPDDITLVAVDDIEHVASLWPFLTVMPHAPRHSVRSQPSC